MDLFGLVNKLNVKSKNFAFTLAEILITLGIIGIIAAITLPALMTNYKIKELEARFKRTDSVVLQAMKLAFYDVEKNDFTDYKYKDFRNSKELYQKDIDNFNEAFATHLSGASKLTPGQANKQNLKSWDFWGTRSSGYGLHMQGFNYRNTFCWILQDGAMVCPAELLGSNTNDAIMTFRIDTNGPYKGPNRPGYDLFNIIPSSFYINQCDPLTSNTYGVQGCYSYAHKNRNPYNASSTYWKSLYKDKTYWQNIKKK